MNQLKEAKKYWEKLGDIPIDENDRIEQDFDIFAKGTYKFEIWHHIEEHFNISIATELLNY